MSNWITRNLILALAYIVGLVIVISILLSVLTQHSKIMTVPDMTGLSVEQARDLALTAQLSIDVTDSVYVPRMQRGAVFSQNPVAGSKVKQGRTVRLSINAVAAKKVTMPNLVGYSMRQAKAELSSRGLRLGRLIYTNDMATNNVLRQIFRGDVISPGTSIESGSFVDLVLGLNAMDNKTIVPDVTGLKYQRSIDEMQDSYLNVRNTVFDRSVLTYSDSLSAVVWKQRPGPSDVTVPMGSEVTLYYTLDESKVPHIAD